MTVLVIWHRLLFPQGFADRRATARRSAPSLVDKNSTVFAVLWVMACHRHSTAIDMREWLCAMDHVLSCGTPQDARSRRRPAIDNYSIGGRMPCAVPQIAALLRMPPPKGRTPLQGKKESPGVGCRHTRRRAARENLTKNAAENGLTLLIGKAKRLLQLAQILNARLLRVMDDLIILEIGYPGSLEELRDGHTQITPATVNQIAQIVVGICSGGKFDSRHNDLSFDGMEGTGGIEPP
nr:MAG TPA: hypothetical protein [Bacteriophage sp.]